MDRRKQVLSCIQPTGKLHLGRYFGAVRNWVELQEKYDCVYGIVDLHAMTMPFNPKKLREKTWELTINLLATGIDPDNLFIQSLVPEHTELAWIFNCMSSFGEVGKMTQFKDKKQQVKEKSKDVFVSTGLFTYPVLQAADILIYKADFVPVGKDQVQHLELSRNIAVRFNQVAGKEYFKLPEPLFTEIPKVMSTADPTRKMSASLGEKHNIDIFAEEQVIRKKIRSAVTDSGENQGGEKSPGLENLFLLLKASGKSDIFDEANELFSKGKLQYGHFKQNVADAIISMLQPMQEKRKEILADKKRVKNRIKASSEVIRVTARQTLNEVKDLMGLLNVRS